MYYDFDCSCCNTLILLFCANRGRPTRRRAGMQEVWTGIVASWDAGIHIVILLHAHMGRRTSREARSKLAVSSFVGIHMLSWMHTEWDMYRINMCGLRQICLGREGVFEYEYPYISLSYRHMLYSKSVCMYIALCMSAYTHIAYDYICTVLCNCMCMNTHSHTEYELYAFCTNFGSSAIALDQTCICEIR